MSNSISNKRQTWEASHGQKICVIGRSGRIFSGNCLISQMYSSELELLRSECAVVGEVKLDVIVDAKVKRKERNASDG